MNSVAVRRSKSPRGPLSRAHRGGGQSQEPTLVTKRKNAECVFDALIEKLAAQAKLGLDRDQKLLAKAYAMYVVCGITGQDPMFDGLSGAIFTGNGLDLTCRRNRQAACQGVQFLEFLPKFGIKKGTRQEPSRLRGHGVNASGSPVVIPFEQLFGAELAHGIARYLVRYMKSRQKNGWPNSVRKRENKDTWVSYAEPKT